jgi:hypothetical protein
MVHRHTDKRSTPEQKQKARPQGGNRHGQTEGRRDAHWPDGELQHQQHDAEPEHRRERIRCHTVMLPKSMRIALGHSFAAV